MISGLVEIRGTALDTNFESYKLEFSPNTAPYNWQYIAGGTTPIANGILGNWNTTALTDGEYVLHLTVNDKAGNSQTNSIVVQSQNDNWKLNIFSLTQLTSSDAWDLNPVWSPDGSKIAFTSNRSGNYEIWIMNADGSGLKNLTNRPSNNEKPAWSPDGSKIAFVSDRSGNKDIWFMNADGSGEAQQLTSLTAIDTDPYWSPDGGRIAFSSNRSGNYNLWMMNADGSGLIKLTSSEANDREPNWSQFGLAYTSDITGEKEIWMIKDVSDPVPFRITNNLAEDKEPCWSPFTIHLSDGSNRPLITFSSNRGGNQSIWVTGISGIDQSKSLIDYTNVSCNPAWSPAGGRVAFSSYQNGSYGIWVMNFAIKTSALSVRTGQIQKPRQKKPANDSTVQTLRPNFEWTGIQGVTDYRLELAKTASWATPYRKILKSITQTEASTAEPYIIARIDEFDEALTPDTWYWKIFALSGSQEIASDDSFGFTVAPELTLTGVTNFPNPFNPTRERTKIRYRLGTDADEVKIRIYDITGSLVTELDGTTNGEGSSIWNKYNDVEWDGRNGRGDLVMNGIYPFEITARLGDRTLTGRGKVAVLK